MSRRRRATPLLINLEDTWFPAARVGVVTDASPRAGASLSPLEDLDIRSGDALFAFDEERRILSWNEAAEELTGIPAEEAIGEPCWQVLSGLDVSGGGVCHARCSSARLAAQGWPVSAQGLLIKTRDGRRPVTVSTISLRRGDSPLFLHVLRNGAELPGGQDARSAAREPHLTPRQREVLELLSDGVPAKVIGQRLGIAEPTIRNHISAILRELGSHSQLEALAKARHLRLVA